MHYGSDTGAGHYFEGGVISPDPNMHFGLRFNSVDGIIDFDANDYLYYSRSNDEYLFMIGGSTQLALSGGGLQVSNVFTVGDGNFGMSLNGSSPYIAFDNTDFLGYNRSSNIFSFNIGNSSKAQIDGYGNVSTAGFIYPSSDSNFWLGLLSGPRPAINFDANDFIQYDRTANSLTTYIGGAGQFAVNPAGTFVANVLTIGDGNFAANLNGGMPTFQFDGGDYIQFNRSSNTYAFNIGAATKASLDSSGNFLAAGSVAPSNDANFLLKTTSGIPQILFDSGGDSYFYDRSANQHKLTIGGTTKIVVDTNGLNAAGFVAAGSYVQIGDVNFYASLVSGNPQVTFDSGDNITFERTLNKFLFMIGGVVVASIDASGNMRLKGTLTQSVTP